MNTDELDDEWKPTRIKIPKVNEEFLYTLHINKTQVYGDPRGKRTVVLKKCEFDGFTIPAGTVITTDNLTSASVGMIQMWGSELNKILKRLYLDTLRTVKKK